MERAVPARVRKAGFLECQLECESICANRPTIPGTFWEFTCRRNAAGYEQRRLPRSETGCT